jgi:hypothetical protein
VFAVSLAIVAVHLALRYLEGGRWTHLAGYFVIAATALLAKMPSLIVLGLLAGLTCSCCWVTKYNGWLPCAIILTALVLNLFLTRQLFHVKQIIAPMLAMMLGCFVLRGLHVWKLVEDQLFQAVSQNHAGYFVGLDGWWGSLLEHSFQLDHTRNILTLSLFFCFVFTVFAIPLSTKNKEHEKHVHRIGEWLLAPLFIFAGTGLLGVGLSLFTLFGLMTAFRSFAFRRECFTWNQLLPLVILFVWWGSLFVAIPLYSPFPRLIYPWLIACWMGMGLTIASFQEVRVSQLKFNLINYIPGYLLFLIPSFFFIVSSILYAYSLPPLRNYPRCDGWQVRTGMRDVSRETVGLIQGDQEGTNGKVPVVYQLSEPAISFQMLRLGITCLPVQNLSFTQNKELLQQCRVYFMVGERGRKSGDFVKEWEQRKSQFKLVKSFEYHPSPFVWMDERGDFERKEVPREIIELYEFVGGGSK